jgi:hypothetical protein
VTGRVVSTVGKYKTARKNSQKILGIFLAGFDAPRQAIHQPSRLHSTEAVLAIVGPQHVAMRQKMLGLPAKTARALATMTDAVEIQKMLTGEVREALAELVGFRQKDVAARRRQRVKGNGGGTSHEQCETLA